jgi:hypothetical protein
VWLNAGDVRDLRMSEIAPFLLNGHLKIKIKSGWFSSDESFGYLLLKLYICEQTQFQMIVTQNRYLICAVSYSKLWFVCWLKIFNWQPVEEAKLFHNI